MTDNEFRDYAKRIYCGLTNVANVGTVSTCSIAISTETKIDKKMFDSFLYDNINASFKIILLSKDIILNYYEQEDTNKIKLQKNIIEYLTLNDVLFIKLEYNNSFTSNDNEIKYDNLSLNNININYIEIYTDIVDDLIQKINDLIISNKKYIL